MDMGLFRKIVDDAATIPPIRTLTITGLGEPLLDRALPERLRYAHDVMGKQLDDFSLFTNGALLNDEIYSVMRGRLTELYVSLNAVDAIQRTEIMGLNDFAATTQYLEGLMSRNGRPHVIVKSLVAKDLQESGHSDEFMLRWGANGTGNRGFLHLEGNWAGNTWKMRTRPRTSCIRAMNQIMVLWDGRVALCCFDGEGRVILGDLNTQTIREVFNGEKAVHYREAHNNGKRSELELCRDCTAI